MSAKKIVPKKQCPTCRESKEITRGFYKTSSPIFAVDGCVPICIACVKKDVTNEDGTVNLKKLQQMLKKLDKPWYKDNLNSSYEEYKRKHGFLSDDEVAKHGKDIVGIYFKNTNSISSDKNRSYEDSEKDGFMHQNNNMSITKKRKIVGMYSEEELDKGTLKSDNINNPLIYSDEWLGDYSKKDVAYLDKYYRGLDRDYKIITENHRDYARKIAKASLQMDKCFNDMINSVEGADVKYKNAREAFDTLSKSAKFSESTRSVNDVGISSFSKITEMVENHNWIPEHKPIAKDDIDKLLDYLSTITKSL